MNQKYLMFSCKHLTKEFRILIKEEATGNFKEWYLDIHLAECQSGRPFQFHREASWSRPLHMQPILQNTKKSTPVIFHNSANYDSYLIAKDLGVSKGNIKCIPYNEEKHVIFSKDVMVIKVRNEKGKEVQVKNELRFMDSFKFMASSLFKLV